MKQQSINFLLTVLMSMVGAKAFAHDIAFENADGKTIFYKWTNNNTELAVSYMGDYRDSYDNEYFGDIVIPESVTYNGTTYSVTSIGNSAFYKCSGLASVTIPNSVISIGSDAFDGTAWYNNQPDGLVYVGKIAYKFKGSMPKGTSITLKDGTLGIGVGAFSGCSSLASVTIPNSVTSIGKDAFYDCCSLTSVTIPNSVTEIGDYAFEDCSGLTSITIPNSVTEIGSGVFSGCSSLASVTIPNSVTEIGSYAFSGCRSLTSVTIPNSVTSIGSYAFYKCSGLTSVTIPNSVTSIGSYAFYNTYLNSVTIGTGVLSIGSDAFSYYSYSNGHSNGRRPVKVIWLTNTPPSGYSNASGTVNYVANDLYTSLDNKTVYPFLSSMFEVDGVKYVPVSPSERTCDAIDCLYDETAENINIGATVSNKGISMTVKQVHPYALYGNTFIKDVKLSLGGNIGNYAFYECTGITNVEISNQGDIGDYAFNGCTGIAKVEISNQGNIGSYAFNGCTGITNVEINNQGYIGSSAFRSTGLKTLEIGNNVTDIYGSAFYGCSGLTTAQINNKGWISYYVFQSCTSLQTATLGQDITYIGEYAFRGCSKLESIVIPDAVTGIGKYAFQGCESMTTAKIGSGVETISSYAFSDCSSLTNLQIGSNVNTIDNGAFSGCSSLPTITIPWAVTDINNYVFGGCTKLSTVIMEDFPTTSKPVISYDDWTSTNHTNNSTSSYTYTFDVEAGDVLSFDYSVSSESRYDVLTITINGTTVVTASGEETSSYQRLFTTAGTVTMTVKYTKDDSNSKGFDQAKVYNIKVGGAVEQELKLGSNGSSSLFEGRPLDSVYIGRNISYSMSPFYRNTSLRAVTITDKETEISANEFYGCTNLKNVSIGDGVKTIGDWAFSGCSSLDFFAFGSSVESIGKEAFSDCTAMTRLISHAATPPTCGSQALDDINKWNCTLSVPQGTTAAYQQASQWKEFFFINDDVLSVRGIVADRTASPARIFNLRGQRLSAPQRGLNIVDGKKVMVK